MGTFAPKETSATADVELATAKSASTTFHPAKQWPSTSRKGVTTEPPPPYQAPAALQPIELSLDDNAALAVQGETKTGRAVSLSV